MPVERGEIRALTVLQPFASALMFGPKDPENRFQRLHLPEGGIWVAIHAGLRLYPANEAGIREVWPECPAFKDMVRGSILGLRHLKEIRRYDPSQDAELRDDPWATGPWCWMFGRRLIAPEPIPHRGMQGLWRPAPDALARLEILLEENGLSPTNFGE